jgi:hypothetical protein
MVIRVQVLMKFISKMYPCGAALTLMFLLAGCGRNMKYYEELHAGAYIAYFGSDRTIAKKALEAYVAEIEANRSEIEGLHQYNYNILAGDAWLRLASIYRSENLPREESFAMNRAVSYYDNDPNFIRDKRYSGLERHKRAEALKEMINQAENQGVPKWKNSSGK